MIEKFGEKGQEGLTWAAELSDVTGITWQPAFSLEAIVYETLE